MLMYQSNKAAKLQYLPSSYRILRSGQFVVCAVSGAEIPLEELCYWSADYQEAYATAEIATERLLGKK
ncbi:MAG: DUF2093 domain-containing protein [Pseudomonadota bacterium]